MAGVDLTTTLDLAALMRDLPAPDAPAAVRADWLARKAAALDRIAAQERGPCVAAAELACNARTAAERARRGLS